MLQPNYGKLEILPNNSSIRGAGDNQTLDSTGRDEESRDGVIMAIGITLAVVIVFPFVIQIMIKICTAPLQRV